jgi:antirestriction protein ArdC
MPTQNEIRERITNQIIEALSKGGLPPWRMPWRNDPNAGFPTNVVSQKRYQGINPLLLQLAAMRHGFQSKWWGTYKQWQDIGGQVQKRPDGVEPGEWGCNIIFFKPVQSEEDEETKTIFVMKTYTVFCIDQVDGLDALRVGHSTNTNPIDTYEEADRTIEATGADIRYGGNRAYYDRKNDYIQVPTREQFTAGDYFETVLHELIHWSEHPNRLDWCQAERPYAMGELIAEMGSCFLAAELGIPNAETLPNHASYLERWLREMQSDPKYIFQASSQASKAADFILSFSRQEALV